MNTELSAKKILQQYHNAFYKLFHVPLDWIDQKNRTFTLCSNEHCHPLCRKIMDHRHGRESCEKLTSERIQRCRSSRTFQISRCHAGLVDAIVPLFVGNRYIGSLCVGQFLREKLSEDDLRSLRRRLDYLELPPGELEQYYAQTPVIPPEQLEGMLELLRMIGEYVGESESKILFLRSINESNPVLAAREYIEIHFKSKLTVEGIARKIGMSPSYFSHIFQKETGSSPIQYLNSFRIQKASELLQETSLSISEIAFECGFQSLPHFNRMFRKITGKNPKAFR